MEQQFKVYTDRLKKGGAEPIQFEADPSFLQVNEKELKFNKPVEVSGEAYLADAELVIRLRISTTALMCCSICNGPVEHPIDIEQLYYSKPLSEITSNIFDFSSEVREAVLLEVPFVVECSAGKCPERDAIAKYLAPPKLNQNDEPDGWQPFKDL